MIKKVRINEGKIGLIFKKGDYKKVLTSGTYWITSSHNVEIYDMSLQFNPSISLELLKNDKDLMELLHLVKVGDSEIVLHFVNGNFNGVLQSGEYAFWNTLKEHSFITADLSKVEITEDISSVLLKIPAVYQFLRVYRIESYEKGLLFINDKFVETLENGMHYFWKNDIPVSVMKADLRQTQLEVSGQELLTKDKAAIRVSFFAGYKVVDVIKALTENQDYSRQLYVAIQLALREYVGALTLDEILEKKEEVSNYVMDSVKEKAKELGVEMLNGGLRDVILPGDVREIMNQVLIAQKKAQANIITRREETASTRSLLNTAKLMEENAMLFKLKEMEYVEKIADKINTISLSGGGQIVDQLRDIFSPSN